MKQELADELLENEELYEIECARAERQFKKMHSYWEFRQAEYKERYSTKNEIAGKSPRQEDVELEPRLSEYNQPTAGVQHSVSNLIESDCTCVLIYSK